MQTVSILNLSTVLSDEEVGAVIPDFQIQVSRDFAPVWAMDAQLVFCPKNGGPPAPGSWWLVILDDSDQATAVGYHDLTPSGLPLGKVFAKTDAQSGHLWTITMSHELLEMLADPWMNRSVVYPQPEGLPKILAYEVCDACEDDTFGYRIGNVTVSDFVYPAWFDVNSKADTFDLRGLVKRPLQLLAGGYIGTFDPVGGWTQITAPNVDKQFELGLKTPRQATRPFGGRRERRYRKGLGIPLLRSVVESDGRSVDKALSRTAAEIATAVLALYPSR